MTLKLRAERYWDEAMEEVELDTNSLVDLEFEREKFRNLRETDAILWNIIDRETVVWVPEVVRAKYEVRNGVKIAMERGANLDEVEVFNLLFRFRRRSESEAVALMRLGPKGEEWILLCADNTQVRIQDEWNTYQEIAQDLHRKGKISAAFHNQLLFNLQQLDVGKRCANSLQHEFGHVLQYRIWTSEGLNPRNAEDLYEWFYEIGYVDCVGLRDPEFLQNPILNLKESFVEDYRIGLNLKSQKGIFELPNVICYRGDFEHPELMYEGVEIVTNVIDNMKYGADVKKKQAVFLEQEPDTIPLIRKAMEVDHWDFDPQKGRLTEEDHRVIRERVRELARKG